MLLACHCRKFVSVCDNNTGLSRTNSALQGRKGAHDTSSPWAMLRHQRLRAPSLSWVLGHVTRSKRRRIAVQEMKVNPSSSAIRR
jgi:hypothetical protein